MVASPLGGNLSDALLRPELHQPPVLRRWLVLVDLVDLVVRGRRWLERCGHAHLLLRPAFVVAGPRLEPHRSARCVRLRVILILRGLQLRRERSGHPFLICASHPSCACIDADLFRRSIVTPVVVVLVVDLLMPQRRRESRRHALLAGAPCPLGGRNRPVEGHLLVGVVLGLVLLLHAGGQPGKTRGDALLRGASVSECSGLRREPNVAVVVLDRVHDAFLDEPRRHALLARARRPAASAGVEGDAAFGILLFNRGRSACRSAVHHSAPHILLAGGSLVRIPAALGLLVILLEADVRAA
mmetsp:Transcript_102962/g.297699  ORF Transcript_102962/g.297699 Transcript_102962/m.297699 type:complete len:299 (-) Transcript_102962:569-1465(-)